MNKKFAIRLVAVIVLNIATNAKYMLQHLLVQTLKRLLVFTFLFRVLNYNITEFFFINPHNVCHYLTQFVEFAVPLTALSHGGASVGTA